MADVLEHMPFPKRALHHARRLLRSDGLLFLSMPNADSFLWQILNRGRANPYWAEIEHYHNFGRKRLHALLGECGFEPVRYGVSFRYRSCMEVIARKREVRSGT
jgi:SAM-dependent methyltransferase